MVGINDSLNITFEQVTDLANITQPHEFFIKVNWVVFDGWLYFILLILTWIILYLVMQAVRDQILNNAMYSGAVISIVAFLLRAVTMDYKGVTIGLLTDRQMWMFPVLTIILAGVVWMIKRNQ